MSIETETRTTRSDIDRQKHSNNHEIEAEINARMIALKQSDSNAIAHLENVLGAILQTMDNQDLIAFRGALSEIETLTTEEKEVVQIYGEMSSDGKIVKDYVAATVLVSLLLPEAILFNKGQFIIKDISELKDVEIKVYEAMNFPASSKNKIRRFDC